MAAGALIVAGLDTTRRTFVSPLLENRLVQWLGDTSYSLYLWHFPVLIIGSFVLAPAGWLVTSCLVLASVVLAGLTFRFVETPVRASTTLKHRPWHSLTMGLALICLTAGTASGLSYVTKSSVGTFINDAGHSVVVSPDPLDAKAEQAESQIISGCAFGFENASLAQCDFGSEKSSKTVVLLGDSLARNVLAPLSTAAQEEGWRLNAWVKSSCTPADVTLYERIRKIEYKQCDEFREESFERTIALKPDIVILVAGVDPGMRVFDRDSETLLTVKESAPVVLAGWRETIERFTSKGIEVVVVPGWARAPHDPVTCLLDSRDARECSFEFNAAFAAAAPARVAAEGVSGAEALSLDYRICTDGLCNVIKGSTLVYYDSVHVTRLFAEEFVPDFRELLHRHK